MLRVFLGLVSFIFAFSLFYFLPLDSNPPVIKPPAKNPVDDQQIYLDPKIDLEELFKADELPPEVTAPIWGKVADTKGKAIAGAKITVWPLPLKPKADADEIEIVRYHLSREKWREDGKLEVESDSDGRFEIAKLRAAVYAVSASLNSDPLYSYSGESVDPGTYVLFCPEKMQPPNKFDPRFASAHFNEEFYSQFQAPLNSIWLEVKYPPNCKEVAVRCGLMRIDPTNPPSLERFNKAARWTNLGADQARIAKDLPAGSYMVGISLGQVRKSANYGEISSRRRRPGPAQAAVVSTIQVKPTGVTNAVLDVPEPDLANSICVDIVKPATTRVKYFSYKISSGKNKSNNWRRCGFRDLGSGKYTLTDLNPETRSILSGEAEGNIRVQVTSHSEIKREGAVNFGDRAHLELSFERPGCFAFSAGANLSPDFTSHIRFELSPYSGFLNLRHIDGKIVSDPIEAGEYTLRIVRYSYILHEQSIVIESGNESWVPYTLERMYPVQFLKNPKVKRTNQFRFINRLGDMVYALYFEHNHERLIYLPKGVYQLRSKNLEECFDIQVPINEAIYLPQVQD